MSNTKIMDRLLSLGVLSNEIEFTSTSSFRYRYWAPLPPAAMAALDKLIEEEVYEDHDGDDERGRPIIRRLYSYNNTAKTTKNI